MARLLPQLVYHVWSYLTMVRDGHLQMGEPMDLIIPTGNFGNILGAYYAKVRLFIKDLVSAVHQVHMLWPQGVRRKSLQ